MAEALAAPVISRCQRSLIQEYLWERCNEAWARDDVEEAGILNRFHDAINGMNDEEWQQAYADCKCDDL